MLEKVRAGGVAEEVHRASSGLSRLAMPQPGQRATIFALSSGAPPAGVAIVRVSGPLVRQVLSEIAGGIPEARRAVLRSLVDPGSGMPVDRGVVVFFEGPRSFTGEDVAEFHLHGGRAVIAAMIDALGAVAGLRLAEPGEFTRQAFDNGRLDLAEAEGLADLVAAETEMQRRQALRQAEGGLSTAYEGWRSRLIRARAMIEAELDFADEDDVPPGVSERAFAEISAVAGEIGAVLARGSAGERLRDGAEIVLLGAPNSGKSTLLNAIAGREVAIVSEEPGTTRDLLEVRLDLGGYPATLVDTAGVRETESRVEREGVRRARARAQDADLVVVLEDVAAPGTAPAAVRAATIRVGAKADLIDSDSERESLQSRYDHLISARRGEGMADFLEQLGHRVRSVLKGGETAVVTRARHRTALEACQNALGSSIRDRRAGAEIVAEHLRRASDFLGRVTGRVDVEDVLGAIFSEFCIGK
jgi:tRNA modification GTPase